MTHLETRLRSTTKATTWPAHRLDFAVEDNSLPYRRVGNGNRHRKAVFEDTANALQRFPKTRLKSAIKHSEKFISTVNADTVLTGDDYEEDSEYRVEFDFEAYQG